MIRFYFTMALVCISPLLIGAQTTDMDAKIRELMSRMTLAEKVGQMNQYNGFYEATGPAPAAGDARLKYEHLASGKVGSVLNVRGVDEVREMQKVVVENSRLGIPLIFASDVIHGYKTLAPIPLAEAASWDLEAIQQSARMAATEGSATGLNWTFAPMVDIYRDARWGRVMEGAGEDPFLGSKIAAARVRGFQGDDLSATNTLMACAKHFAGYGFAEAGRDYNTVDVGTYTLHNVILPPFKAAAEAGVGTFMNAFNILNGVPATADAFLQRDILKGDWNFDGFVVSDWGSIKEIAYHGAAGDLKEAARRAAIAGSDMDMESYAYVKHLEDLVETGAVDEALINDAVYRILKAKFELGLFDDPYAYCDNEREEELLYNEKHQEIALDMAKRSIVLLKNEDELLPLARNNQKIAVIGQLANDKTSPLGSWRIGSDDGTAVSVIEGLAAYDANMSYAQGPALWRGNPNFVTEVEVNESDRSGMEEAVAAAKEAEVVLMVLGEHGFMSGEGRSRTDIGLPGLQQELLEAVYAVNPNIVLVLMNGRPLALPWAAENIPAIIEAWQLGSQSGNAIAQVLYGDYNPSGHLPMSFPRSVGQVPLYYNHFSTGRPTNRENNVFWTHYIDEKNTPLFPFGYGLSYTSFAYSALQINDSDPNAVEVSVVVMNTGNRTGEEVVQLYIQDPAATYARPVRELKGFEKIELAAGEAQTVTFRLTPKELGYYHPDGTFVTEPGTFNVQVGPHALEGLQGSFERE
jgi:beta-glucosidase